MYRTSNYLKLLTAMFLVLMSTILAHSQSESDYSKARIQHLIDVDSLDQAEKELRIQNDYFTSTKQYDSLSNLVYFHGQIALLKNESDFIKKSINALEQLKELTNNSEVLYNAYSDMASLTIQNGMNQESYDYNALGFNEAKKTSQDRQNKMSKRAYGMSSTSYYMRRFDDVKKHGIQAFKINENNPNASAANVYSACNILGLMMQSENKLDSALYYYKKGVNALKQSDGKNLNERYYYPAVLSGNMAIIYMNQGKFSQSLNTQYEAIRNYKVTIDSSQNNPRLANIKYNYLSTINDMGSNYVKLGQIERAQQLFDFNYQKAKDYFPENSIQQVIFIKQYAQAKWVAGENEIALKLIDEAEAKFKNLSEDYAGYMTFAMATKANILENLDRIEAAYEAFKYSDELYDIVNPGKYSHDRLTNLREASLFYSRNGYGDEANETANRILTVVKETASENYLEVIKTYNLFSEIQYNLKNYDACQRWSDKAINVIEKNEALTSADSIYWRSLKIEPMLFKSKAKFQLIDTTNVTSLNKIHDSLKKLINIHNENTAQYTSEDDKNFFLERTKPLFEFSMKVGIHLYELTADETYLDHVISIHESTIYNRIRSKIGLRDNVKFKNVPKTVLENETALKDSLASFRSQVNSGDKSIQNFMAKHQEWQSFLEDLKLNHPKYYALRYEMVKQSLGTIQDNIPSNTTVIRYFFVDGKLYAFVSNHTTNTLHQLDSTNLTHQIEQISTTMYDSEDAHIFETMHQLYKQLWQPIDNDITSTNVIIIPDRELFNLSFETLITQPIDNLNALADASLLSRHIISYNYSLYLLDKNRKIGQYDNDYIAFAPGFNATMKQQYKIQITDSFAVDKTYLTLLPQPFTEDLVKQYSKLFNGDSFVNEKASKQVFTREAKEHKIIHIGTHAESNNYAPELSRLIFAKPVNDSIASEDNSLYTYEIYNQNLASNLAILTACETGKPTYQAGEGMISLAHAFNYAGSESILTSLWKIDEQSSAQIIEHFYDHIKKGLPKDKALQHAKLDYISNARGRTLAPQYWAGLVLIGDTSPIVLQHASNLVFWIGIICICLILIVVFLRRKKSA